MTARRECKTCFRWQPLAYFQILVSEDELEDGFMRLTHNVPICYPCRVKLWDNPMDQP